MVLLYKPFVKQFAVEPKLLNVDQQNFYTMMMGVRGITPSFDGNYHQAQHRAGVETTTKYNTELEWKPPPRTTPSLSGKIPRKTPSYNGNHHHAFKSSYNQAQHRAGVETTTKHNTELE